MTNEIVIKKRQDVWGLPAAANFILGGTGAGLFVFLSLCELLGPKAAIGAGPAGLLAPILVSAGFLALTREAGRPLRGLYAIRNIRRSWMSVEVLSGSVFVIVSVLDCIRHTTLSTYTALCAGALFMLSQGFIVYRARAIAPWNTPTIPLIFFLSGLAGGGGLALTVQSLLHMAPEHHALIVLRVCLTLDAALWALYLLREDDPEFVRATSFLRGPVSLILVLAIGRLLPLSILAIFLFFNRPLHPTEGRIVVLVLAGLSILAGGAFQKVGLIMGGGFFRGIEVPKLGMKEGEKH